MKNWSVQLTGYSVSITQFELSRVYLKDFNNHIKKIWWIINSTWEKGEACTCFTFDLVSQVYVLFCP